MRPPFPGTPDSSKKSANLTVELETQAVSVYYGSHLAVKQVSLKIPKNHITAFIGPSGCGKSTLLRCFNRMNDLIPGARVEGSVIFHGKNIYDPDVDPAEVRRRVGLVFQKPNPFPKSIYDNIAFGPRVNGYQGDLDELVERTLRQAVLWDEVKDKLKMSGLSLSGGQQQRLCIARTLAIQPEVILMDEPCASLDPISTLRIEELLKELGRRYTIIISLSPTTCNRRRGFLTLPLSSTRRSTTRVSATGGWWSLTALRKSLTLPPTGKRKNM